MTHLDSQRTTPPPRLAVDGRGYVWRVYDDGHWSMAPSNSDNSPIPEPITYYAQDPSGWDEEILASIEEAKRIGRDDLRGALVKLADEFEQYAREDEQLKGYLDGYAEALADAADRIRITVDGTE